MSVLNVVQPLQSLGDEVTKGLKIGLVRDGARFDTKCQQRIPRVQAVDGHLNTALWAPFYLAKVVVDHCRQLFSGLFFFCRSLSIPERPGHRVDGRAVPGLTAARTHAQQRSWSTNDR